MEFNLALNSTKFDSADLKLLGKYARTSKGTLAISASAGKKAGARTGKTTSRNSPSAAKTTGLASMVSQQYVESLRSGDLSKSRRVPSRVGFSKDVQFQATSNDSASLSPDRVASTNPYANAYGCYLHDSRDQTGVPPADPAKHLSK